MAAGGIALLLLALLPVAGVLLFFARAALLLLALIAAVGILAVWLARQGGSAVLVEPWRERGTP